MESKSDGRPFASALVDRMSGVEIARHPVGPWVTTTPLMKEFCYNTPQCTQDVHAFSLRLQEVQFWDVELAEPLLKEGNIDANMECQENVDNTKFKVNTSDHRAKGHANP